MELLHTHSVVIGWASQIALAVKNLPAKAGDTRVAGFIPGLGGSPGGGHGKPLQYSCLENPMNRGAWQVTVHWVAKSWTKMKLPSTHVSQSSVRKSLLKIWNFTF